MEQTNSRERELGRRYPFHKWAPGVATVVAVLFNLWTIAKPIFKNKFYTGNDLGAFAIPLKYLYAQGLRAGRIDLWSPAIFGGFYLHGEGQLGILHPLHLMIYRYLPFLQAFDVEVTACYCVLLAGAFCLFRQWNVTRAAAGFGALVFTFAGSNLTDIVHTNEMGVIAQAPWLMVALDKCIRGESRLRTLWCVAIALLNASQILLGHPYYYLMSAAFQVWYVLYLSAGKIWSPGVVRAFLATALGAAIGAIQLLPTWSVIQTSTRHAPNYDFLSAVSMEPFRLIQFVNPFVVAYTRFSFLLYPGITTLLLFFWICGRKQDPDRRLILFLAGLAALGIFLSFGKYNGIYRLYYNLPGLKLFRYPVRFMLFTDFALAGSAALALDRIVRAPDSQATRANYRLAAGFAVLSVMTVIFAAMAHFTGNESRFGLASFRSVTIGCAIVCAGAVLFISALRSRKSALALFWVFGIADMTLYASLYLRRIPASNMDYYAVQGPPVPAPGPVVPQCCDTLATGGYWLANGYAGLEPGTSIPTDDPRYLRLLGVKAYQNPDLTWHVTSWPNVEPVRLVQPVFSRDPADALSKIDLEHQAVVAESVLVNDKSSAPGSGSVRIVERQPDFIHITAETSGRALCLLAQRYHPGWTGRVGGRALRILRIDGDLTGFVLPGGKQDVILEFKPVDYLWGRDITWAALAVAGAMFALGIAKIATARGIARGDPD